jgi:choice-of-anchor B domain-containing protein
MRIVGLLLCLALVNAYNDGAYEYNLNALSSLPYRRIAIDYQYETLMNACETLMKYSPDIMVMDCALQQLFATDDLVIAGLLMANSTDEAEQQEGYKLLDQVTSYVYSDPPTPMLPLNDCWGYDDPITGRSYALIGASNGVHIVDVTVPLAPVSIYFLQGSFSLWRDIKIWNSTLYATNDNNFGSILNNFPNVNQSYIQPWLQMDGLVIIDLTYALQPHFARKDNTFFYTAHNLQVEFNWDNTSEQACSWCRPYAYVVGQQVPGWTPIQRRLYGGFVVLDLSNRTYPTQIGQWNETYIHDIVIQYRGGKHIAYGSAIYAIAGRDPGLYIIDVSDPSNPTTIAKYNATYNYTHNSWPSVDGTTLYVSHETLGAPITIWNITDLQNVKEIGKIFIVPDNKDIVAHNVFVRGNRLWISYYAMGTAVYDITNPVTPILIGLYDTSPDISSGMGGTWGVYPYANNMAVYASDMSNGFFMLNLSITPNPPTPKAKDLTTPVIIFIVFSVIAHVATIIAIFAFARRLGGGAYKTI